jgi:hypothetical protein
MNQFILLWRIRWMLYPHQQGSTIRSWRRR